MIDLIIFSKDRAAQLDLLLRSIKRFYPNIFNIGILYHTSNQKFEDGYTKLWKKQHLPITAEKEIKELSFKDNVRRLYLSMHRAVHYNLWLMFSTDDQVFFKNIELKEEYLPQKVDEVFSFRLGLNTIEQDIHKGTKQPPLNFYIRNGELLSWNPHHYFPLHNYGYPLAIDNHVFTIGFFHDVIQKLNYDSSNSLESQLQNHRFKINVLKSFYHSVSVNIPVNNLSGCTIAGQVHNYSPEYLNSLYLDNKEINLDKIVNTKIDGCHQEIEYGIY